MTASLIFAFRLRSARTSNPELALDAVTGSLSEATEEDIRAEFERAVF